MNFNEALFKYVRANVKKLAELNKNLDNPLIHRLFYFEKRVRGASNHLKTLQSPTKDHSNPNINKHRSALSMWAQYNGCFDLIVDIFNDETFPEDVKSDIMKITPCIGDFVHQRITSHYVDRARNIIKKWCDSHDVYYTPSSYESIHKSYACPTSLVYFREKMRKQQKISFAILHHTYDHFGNSKIEFSFSHPELTNRFAIVNELSKKLCTATKFSYSEGDDLKTIISKCSESISQLYKHLKLSDAELKRAFNFFKKADADIIMAQFKAQVLAYQPHEQKIIFDKFPALAKEFSYGI